MLRQAALILFTFATSSLFAQDFFEGTMNFSVKYEGEMAEMLSQNEPNDQLTMHVKDADYIVLLKGGRYPKTFLFVADSNYEYSVDQNNRRAYRYSPHNDINMETHQLERDVDLEAQDTGETEEVNGTICKIYRLRKPEAVFYYYVSDAYLIDRSKFPDPCRSKASFLVAGLEGRIPLKTVRKEKELTVVTTVTGITAREFNPGQFKIPAGFEVKKRDYRY